LIGANLKQKLQMEEGICRKIKGVNKYFQYKKPGAICKME